MPGQVKVEPGVVMQRRPDSLPLATVAGKTMQENQPGVASDFLGWETPARITGDSPAQADVAASARRQHRLPPVQ
ncbi:hypothetical protein IE994_21395 [Enterobacter hormaechei]|nr:hypothetical protein [Enterobacter hormaechei]